MNLRRLLFWKKAKKDPDHIKTVGLFTGYFFIINFVVGTGFLGVPYSFYNGGILAGAITLILVSFVSGNTAVWTVESMARAQALETAVHHSVNLSDSQHSQPDFEIKLKRKFEPSEMAQVFYGRIMKVVYIFVLSIYCFLAAWSFSTVAGSAWAANLPFSTNVTPTLQKCDYNEFKDTLVPASIECLNVYRLCIFFFGVVSVILSMLELTEQKILQIFLGLLRFVTIGSMVIYSIVRLIQTHGEAPHSANSTQGNTPNMTLGEAFVHFKFNYWLVAIPVFVYSQITHQGIATLTAPVVPKKRLGRFFIAIISTTCIIYTVLGVTVAMYWQESIQETSTLNWVSTIEGGSVALKILSYFIVLFPSIDVVSAYPLMVVTISSNLYVVFTGRDMAGDKRRLVWIPKILLKLVCAVLPLVAALFIANLVSVLQYAGLLGFAICYLFPILFQLSSQYHCVVAFGDSSSSITDSEKEPLIGKGRKLTTILKQWWLTYKNPSYWTPHSTPFSHPFAVVSLSIVCMVFFCLTIGSIVVTHTTRV